jgi:hypothetical protein
MLFFRQFHIRTETRGSSLSWKFSESSGSFRQLSDFSAGSNLLGPPASGVARPEQKQHHPDSLNGISKRSNFLETLFENIWKWSNLKKLDLEPL